jgi:hypothetical protein
MPDDMLKCSVIQEDLIVDKRFENISDEFSLNRKIWLFYWHSSVYEYLSDIGIS